MYNQWTNSGMHLGGTDLKYSIVHRDDDLSQALSQRFHTMAFQRGLIQDDVTPDIVLSIGGDGTMLRAFHQYQRDVLRIAFVGVHTGKLGFFADWQPEEIERLADLMHDVESAESLHIVKYPLVEIEVHTLSGVELYLALNEFTLKGIEETLVAQLDINNELFQMFRGDGICISSPSGSTGYNKSLGGAMVHPAIEAIQIAEIASINNRLYRTLGSSIILPKHHHCDIYPITKQNLLISLDHNYSQRKDIISIRCRVSPEVKVNFARFRPFPFWNRVRDAFIGHEPQ